MCGTDVSSVLSIVLGVDAHNECLEVLECITVRSQHGQNSVCLENTDVLKRLSWFFLKNYLNHSLIQKKKKKNKSVF